MTKLRILDTGFLTSDRSGIPQAGTDITSLGTYIVNSGVAMTLNVTDFNLKSGTNLSAEPNPSSNDTASTAFNTFDNDLYLVSFKINSRDSTERGILKQLHVLSKTKGVKLLYSSDTSSASKMIPEILGRTDTKFHGNEITAGIPVFVCRVKGITIDQKSDSNKYTISGKLTITEEKVIPAT